MPLPRVYADFHDLADVNRLKLNGAGTRRDLARLGLRLEDGLALTLCTDDGDDEGRPDDLCVDGVARYDPNEQCWTAEVDWNSLRHASEEKTHASEEKAGRLPNSPPADEAVRCARKQNDCIRDAAALTHFFDIGSLP